MHEILLRIDGHRRQCAIEMTRRVGSDGDIDTFLQVHPTRCGDGFVANENCFSRNDRRNGCFGEKSIRSHGGQGEVVASISIFRGDAQRVFDGLVFPGGTRKHLQCQSLLRTPRQECWVFRIISAKPRELTISCSGRFCFEQFPGKPMRFSIQYAEGP
jgi:hypothetical protein